MDRMASVSLGDSQYLSHDTKRQHLHRLDGNQALWQQILRQGTVTVSPGLAGLHTHTLHKPSPCWFLCAQTTLVLRRTLVRRTMDDNQRRAHTLLSIASNSSDAPTGSGQWKKSRSSRRRSLVRLGSGSHRRRFTRSSLEPSVVVETRAGTSISTRSCTFHSSVAEQQVHKVSL